MFTGCGGRLCRAEKRTSIEDVRVVELSVTEQELQNLRQRRRRVSLYQKTRNGARVLLGGGMVVGWWRGGRAWRGHSARLQGCLRAAHVEANLGIGCGALGNCPGTGVCLPCEKEKPLSGTVVTAVGGWMPGFLLTKTSTRKAAEKRWTKPSENGFRSCGEWRPPPALIFPFLFPTTRPLQVCDVPDVSPWARRLDGCSGAPRKSGGSPVGSSFWGWL